MSQITRITPLLFCIIPIYGCHSKNLGIPEGMLLDETIPQGYTVAEPPREVFRLLTHAVDNTPQARLLVSDEPSGLIPWLVRAETGEKRKAQEHEGFGEPMLTGGSDGWDKIGGRGDTNRERPTTAVLVVCTAYIRPATEGSRIQIRRAWRRYGQVNLGTPQAWAHESEVLTRAGLRVCGDWLSD